MRIGMRNNQLVLSAALFTFVLLEDLSLYPRFGYVAGLSLLFLIYGIWKNSRSAWIFFSIILSLAYLGACLFYPFEVLSVLKMAVIWPMLFALFSILASPESEELEKRIFFTSAMSSVFSAFSIMAISVIIVPVPNPIVLAVMGMVAGFAMVYIIYK